MGKTAMKKVLVVGMALALSLPLCAAVEFPVPETVRSWDAPEYATNGVKAVWIEGVPWHGRQTRFFAYYSLPEGATAGKKVPGIVLVHGGMGTAYHSWVKAWNSRGYAAIAMDNGGGVPGSKSHLAEHPRHKWSGPNGWGRFGDAEAKPEDQWVYHAVESVIRSHTFLRNLPGVDKSRVGMTGISWGGFLSEIACGADSRFAFVAPVYGCGNLRRHSLWASGIGEKWEALWNPVGYAKRRRVPMLWCAGTNDHFFPLDSFVDTALAFGDPVFSIKLRMTHGHPPFGDPPEIAAFADSVVKGGRKLSERKVARREWLYTESGNPDWEKRPFKTSATKPQSFTICFENAVTEDGLVISSVPEFRKPEPKELTVEVGGMTPEEALQAVRAAKANGDFCAWTVRVKTGMHVLEKPLAFTPEDSGSPEAKVRWVGEKGAVLSGGRVISGWKEGPGGVWEADLPRGADGKPVYVAQLWVNGRRADCARLPNDGYLRIASSTCESDAGGKLWREKAQFTNDEVKALARIPAEDLGFVQLEVVQKWSFARRIVRGYDAACNAVSTTFDRPQDGWRRWSGDSLVAFTNVRAAFDRAGEWFCDMKSGKLLYRPLGGERIAEARIVAPVSKLPRLVRFDGDPDKGRFVTDIEFEGLEIAHSDVTPYGGSGAGPVQSHQYQAAFSSDAAVWALGARRLRFDGCTVRHTGNYAFKFSDGCVSNAVSGCLMEDLGAGGVFLGAWAAYAPGGKEARPRDEVEGVAPRSCAFNFVENCTIRDAGRFNPEGCGILATHCSDSRFVGNDIHDIMYSGISVGWTWGYQSLSVSQRNEIRGNRIWNLGKGVMSDLGGVYLLGTSFGTRVAGNVVHDVSCLKYGGWGLYCDEGCEGAVVEDNLVYDTMDGGFHQHYGVGNYVRNNIFAFNERKGAVRTRARLVKGVPSSLHFYNNIVYVKGSPPVGEGVLNVPGVWANNVYWDAGGRLGSEKAFDGLPFGQWLRERGDVGSVCADPLFADAERRDFRLRPGSPALKRGFRPFLAP